MQEFTYTIGVRRRFGLGVTEYKVHSHRLEILGDRAQLVLVLLDRSELHLPGIGGRAWRVYPDFEAEKQRIASVEADINVKAETQARAMLQRQQHEQLAAMRAQRPGPAVGPMAVPMG